MQHILVWHLNAIYYSRESRKYDRGCPKQERIAFGNVQVTGKGMNAQAIYECKQGLFKNSNMVRKCSQDGQWTGRVPLCLNC